MVVLPFLTTGPMAIFDPIFGSEDRRWGSSIFQAGDRRCGGRFFGAENRRWMGSSIFGFEERMSRVLRSFGSKIEDWEGFLRSSERQCQRPSIFAEPPYSKNLPHFRIIPIFEEALLSSNKLPHLRRTPPFSNNLPSSIFVAKIRTKESLYCRPSAPKTEKTPISIFDLEDRRTSLLRCWSRRMGRRSDERRGRATSSKMEGFFEEKRIR